MTNKEYDIGDGRKVGVIYDNGVAQVSEEVMERILIPRYIRAEKYKWHDLRKDPNDLPQDNTVVYVHCEDGAELKVPYCKGFNCADDCTIYKFNDVIAWKYLEPFKEVEE